MTYLESFMLPTENRLVYPYMQMYEKGLGVIDFAPITIFYNSFYDVVKRKLFEKNDEESNGETAIDYFKERLFPNNLYFLDEPENSMSPILQQELADYICLLAYRLNCQFVLATHSPFMLSMQGARIYDLDSHPSVVKECWQLENMKVYYKLFERFSIRFDTSGK